MGMQGEVEHGIVSTVMWLALVGGRLAAGVYERVSGVA
jgi:hypothetical protein